LGGNLVMTRLLVPEMFGIMAIAIMLMVGVAMFSDLGFKQSVVQSKQGSNPVFLDTVWITQILRGVLIFLVCLGLAVGILTANRTGLLPQGSTYAEPILPAVLTTISFGAVIAGFESTKLLTASRDLVIGRMTVIELLSQIVGLIFMVMFALFSRSIWALVVGGLLAALSRTLLSHIALPGARNRFLWDRESFREILSFGKWIFASSILGFLLSSGDRLLLGGLVSADILGLYSIAVLITSALGGVLQRWMANVAYPALSEIARERPADLKASYYRFRAPIDLLSLFLLGFLHVSGREIVGLLYDSRYRVVGQQVEISALSLFPLGLSLAGHCYLALGKPAFLTALIGLSTVTLYISIPVAFYFFGVSGALWAIALNFCYSLPPTYYFNHQCGLLSVRKEVSRLWALPVGIAAGYCFEMLSSMLSRALT
jgi:O-antigen/teichoic acid export membrane protein